MVPHPDDTIVALASAPGPGARAIVRLSGPRAWEVALAAFTALPPATDIPGSSSSLGRYQRGSIALPDVAAPLPGHLLLGKAPHTYTGQHTAELHTISCPPLLDLLIARLLEAGARSARPGEFTLRAFLAGKKDLPQAEAVLAVVEAGSRDELTSALAQLAGGVTRPLSGLREDLLNLLADVEAGLDFTGEDIEFVGKPDILLRLGKGMAQLLNLKKQLDERSVSGRPFRVALVGAANAGKSSLFNALAGLPAAIVSPTAGTTRDYLTRTVQLGGSPVELIDTAGWRHTGDTIEEQAQRLGREAARRADLLLWCVPADGPLPEPREELDGVPLLRVLTKSDLGDMRGVELMTSAKTGAGIERLRQHLKERAADATRPSLAPSLSRCRHHVEACLEHLRKGHSVVLFDEPAELFALELRLALDHLGEMVGAVYTDDLLDRIFSRFCIGK
jgi:tRNA modification GTPase